MKTTSTQTSESTGQLPDLQNYWNRFNEIFPTIDSCQKELVRLFIGSELKCPECNGKIDITLHKERVVRCNRCRRKVWITSGTILDRMRCPRAWLAALWLLNQQAEINAFRLHKLTDVAYSTALLIFRKIKLALANHLSFESSKVCSLEFIQLYSRRSFYTPAEQHPSAEEEQQSSKNNSNLKNYKSSILATEQSNQTLTIYADGSEISANSERLALLQNISSVPVNFDSLVSRCQNDINSLTANLMLLELEGKILRLPGEKYILNTDSSQNNTKPHSHKTRKIVQRATAFTKRLNQGISRRYLRLYLASYAWYQIGPTNPDALIDACRKSGNISPNQLKSIQTDSFVQVAACT